MIPPSGLPPTAPAAQWTPTLSNVCIDKNPVQFIPTFQESLIHTKYILHIMNEKSEVWSVFLSIYTSGILKSLVCTQVLQEAYSIEADDFSSSMEILAKQEHFSWDAHIPSQGRRNVWKKGREVIIQGLLRRRFCFCFFNMAEGVCPPPPSLVPRALF